MEMLAGERPSPCALARRGLRASVLLGLVALLAAGATPAACAGSKACERNSDCDHAYCDDGECKKDCIAAEVDCPAGFLCNETARCVPPAGWDGGVPDGAAGQAGSGGSAGSSQGGAAGAGGTSQGGAGGTSQGGSSGTGGAPQGGASGSAGTSQGGAGGASREFDTCSVDADCTSGLLCRPMNVNGTKRCTRACTGIGQCMTGTRCSKVPPGSETYCAFDDDGAKCSGLGQCVNACLAGPAANYCTSACNTGADCPAGWGCYPQPIDGMRVCMRLDVDCAQASDCAGGACDPNLVVMGCSMPCVVPSDCPQRGGNLEPWVCSGGFCLRPSDVFGPVSKDQQTEWACSNNQPVNMCADGLTGDGAPVLTCNEEYTVPTSGPCVSSCRHTGGCGYGFACVSGQATINGVSTPICLRTGYAEIGQSCTKHEECLFGLCNNSKCSRDCSQDSVCPKNFSCSGGKCL